MNSFILTKRAALGWVHSVRGSILVTFAVMAPVLLTAIGFSIDLGEAYLVRQRLHGALDAAALAGAASSEDESVIEQKITDFFAANYPDIKIGTAHGLHVQISDATVTVSAQAMFQTNFMWIIGKDTFTVSAETEVSKDASGLEIVMVLDNTGSMDEYDSTGNKKIASLKLAAKTLINAVLPQGGESGVRVGLVPFSNSVRVGKYGLGETPSGGVYNNGETFVTLPSGTAYTTSHDTTTTTKWYGCIIEHNADGWKFSTTGATSGVTADKLVTDNDPHPDDVEDNYEGPWDIYKYSYRKQTSVTKQVPVYKTVCTGKGANKVCTQQIDHYDSVHDYYTYSIEPKIPVNQGCPYATVRPLTNNKTDLNSTIDSMQPEGNTLGNIGMIWGYRMISPEPPFTEGTAWDNKAWKKAVVMMTDGYNTKDSNYSALWLNKANALTTNDYDDRFLEVCQALKDKDVLVYTIIFDTGSISSPDENTIQLYKDCATSEDQYYYAPTQDKLVSIFESIGGQLSTLHISK